MANLPELERLVLERLPEVAQSAAGAATESEVRALEEVVGRVPDSLMELLAWQNGSGSDSWFGEGFWYLLPAREIARIYSEWRSRRGQRIHTIEGESEGVRGWPQQWIPFATWNGDVFVILDGRNGRGSAILGVDFEGGRIKELAASFDNFIDVVISYIRDDRELDVDELMG